MSHATPVEIPPSQPIDERHPPGLYALFASEMWERFSFYGMRALLVLYLTKAMGVDRPGALNIYAIYTGLVYLTPLIGGRLADRYLGQRKAVFIGGILMALGQFAMTQKELLNLGLGLLILGNGFFKPNISTMVGTLYPQRDPRRDGAYTLFYMGINLGAFLAPLVCGPLGEDHGWWPGFAAAGVGMTLGLLTFVFTQRLLQGQGLPPGRPVEPGTVLRARDYVEIVLIAAVGFGFVYGAIQLWPSVQPLWSPAWIDSFAPKDPKMVNLAAVAYKGAVLVGLLTAFLFATEPKRSVTDAGPMHEPLSRHDWQRVAVIVIISLFSIVFWAGFEQSGGTLNLFADQQTDRVVLGRTVPASTLQAANPMFIILLAPIFAALWTALARRNFPLPSFAKQGLGLVILSMSFGVMYLAEGRAKPTAALPARIDAAIVATADGQGSRPLKVAKGAEVAKGAPRTVSEALAKARAEAAEDKIPFNFLKDSEDALQDAEPTAASAAVASALNEARLGQVSPLWLLAVYLMFTVAELFVSPIGLSLVNKLAPIKLASLMMAFWFLCTAAANYLAGVMEHLVEPFQFNLWAFLAGLALVPGILLLLITPILVKMSHGRS